MPNVVDRLGGASSSLAFKAPCRLATTTNITLSGYQSVDGVLPTSSDHVDLRRILVKDQDTASENGIYIMDTGTWARTKDFDGANDIRQGTRMYVFGGSTQSGTYIVTSSVDPSTFDIDTTSITIAEVGTFDQETASLGVSSGGKISFDSDDVTITHSSSALAFAGAGAGFSFAEGVTLSSALNVSGAVALSSAVTLSGAVTLSSAVTMSGAVTISSGLRVGFTGSPGGADRVEVGDAFFYLDIATTSLPLIGFDANDYMAFDRSANKLQFVIGGAEVAAVRANSLSAISGTTITLGGVAGAAILLFGSTTFGIYAGSSAPAISAGIGSLYLRTDGASSLSRAYIQSSGSSAGWVGMLTTA